MASVYANSLEQKKVFYIRKEFNSHRIALVHQYGRHFIVLEHQYGRRDVIWIRSSANGKRQILSWEFLKIENEQVTTGKTNSYE